MEGLGVAASVIAVVELSAKVGSLCLKYSKAVKNAKQSINELHQEVINLKNCAENVQQLLNSPNGAKLKTSQQLRVAVKEAGEQLKRLDQNLRPRTARDTISRLGIRALKWPFQKEEVDIIIGSLRRCMQTIDMSLQADQIAILLDIDRKIVLDRLPFAEGACFDSHAQEHSPTCLPNTRVELLDQISRWANDPGAKTVFWLNGMAGTGKSTISRTVARSFGNTGHLGASFFFKRGETDRGNLSKFCGTIAADLVDREPAIAPHIQDALDSDPAILRKGAREQFNQLIMQPLAKISPNVRQGKPIVLVIDALDECERDEDIKLVIGLFSRAKSLQPLQLKTLLTSRPELPIRLGFIAVDGTYQDLILHKIPEAIIQHDITAFLKHELSIIKANYNDSVTVERQLSTNWPNQSKLQSLVKMAIPLFIFAATVCRFVSDRRFGSPDEQLEEVLRFETKNHVSQLGATYLPILSKLITGLSGSRRDRLLQQFQQVIGPIIILATPLPISTLAQMLDIPQSAIHNLLDMLHSVLDIPSSPKSPIRLFHLSFRDFLLNSENRETNPFWMDVKQVQRLMVTNCLRIMNNGLRKNMCRLESPGAPRSRLDPKEIDACLSPEVRYACQYWITHTQQAEIKTEDIEAIYGFLKHNFLHWLEALSLMGRAYESPDAMKQLLRVHGDHQGLYAFIKDAILFIRQNLMIIDMTPSQIYCSALVFAPVRSVIRNHFLSEIPTWISTHPKIETDWDQCLLRLEGKGTLHSAAFSSDSALVVSGWGDGIIRIWRVDTGERVQELKDHSKAVYSVASSHDSNLVASGSADGTVRIWRVETGECIQEFSHHCSVYSVAFSHDSTLVASGGRDGLRIWCVDTGKCILERINDEVNLVAFSHDSTLLMSGWSAKMVRIWRVSTGKCMQEYERDYYSNAVALSQKSTLLAVGCRAGAIQIWNIDTGECIHDFESDDEVSALAFSHDSTSIISVSYGGTVQFRCTSTGERIQDFGCPCPQIFHVAFSHDTMLWLSCSYDDVVRIWPVNMSMPARRFGGHGQSVTSISFSHNAKFAILASPHEDAWHNVGRFGIVRIWCTDTGDCKQVLVVDDCDETRAVWSHDSTLVALAAEFEGPYAVIIYQTSTGKCTQLASSDGRAVSLVFSHDLAVTMFSTSNGTIYIGCTSTGERLQTFSDQSGTEFYSLAFSHDSTFIVAGSEDGTIQIWRPESTFVGSDSGMGTRQMWSANSVRCVQNLTGHSGVVDKVVLTRDSALIASASRDNTIRVWRTSTGECLQELKHNDRYPFGDIPVTFSYDSALVASVIKFHRSEHGTVLIWHTDTGECIQQAVVGDLCDRLSFAPGNTHLHTNVGTLILNAATSAHHSLPPTFEAGPCRRAGLGVSPDRCWITLHGTNFLWLPLEFRPRSVAISDHTVVIFCGSERIIRLGFCFDKLPSPELRVEEF